MELAIKILNRIKISKPQKKFLLTLFTTILVTRGKINFRNMSRYSDFCEHTYSRNFAKPFDFIGFNREVIDETFGQESDRILAFDPSFIKKAGKHTFSRDSFWNGCASKAQKGLEISALAVVDIKKHTALTLSVEQTLSQEEAKRKGQEAPGKDKDVHTTRMQQYLDHIGKVAPHLAACEHYIVVDGSFANADFIDGITALNKDIVGKLRCDANCRYLYKGPKRPGRGRQKTYDGKVNWQDLSRFDFVGQEDDLTLYSGLLSHISFNRNLKVVVLLKQAEGETPCYVILFSTDETLDAWQVYRYYKARFQIEFLFRDAKQFTGLCDSQARDQARLDFHFNASLTTLNLAKSEGINAKKKEDTRLWSMGSVKIRAFNQHYLNRIIRIFGLEHTCIKKRPEYHSLMEYGALAA